MRQTLHVTGRVEVPIKQRIRVPLRQTIHPHPEELAVRVKLESRMPAHIKADLNAEVAVDGKVPTRIGGPHIAADELSLQPR